MAETNAQLTIYSLDLAVETHVLEVIYTHIVRIRPINLNQVPALVWDCSELATFFLLYFRSTKV